MTFLRESKCIQQEYIPQERDELKIDDDPFCKIANLQSSKLGINFGIFKFPFISHLFLIILVDDEMRLKIELRIKNEKKKI
jgi:hypothetical protein